jgi:hypothetical protein
MSTFMTVRPQASRHLVSLSRSGRSSLANRMGANSGGEELTRDALLAVSDASFVARKQEAVRKARQFGSKIHCPGSRQAQTGRAIIARPVCRKLNGRANA